MYIYIKRIEPEKINASIPASAGFPAHGVWKPFFGLQKAIFLGGFYTLNTFQNHLEVIQKVGPQKHQSILVGEKNNANLFSG